MKNASSKYFATFQNNSIQFKHCAGANYIINQIQ